MPEGRGWFNDTIVRNKILLGFATVLVFMLAITVVVISETGRIAELTDQFEQADSLQDVAFRLQSAIQDEVVGFRSYLITGDDSELQELNAAAQRFEEMLTGVREGGLAPEVAAELDPIAEYRNAWIVDVVQPGVQLRQRVNAGALPVTSIAEFFRSDGRRTAARALDATDELMVDRGAAAREARRELENAERRIFWVTLICTILAIALAAGIAVYIARRISVPLVEAVGLATRVAEGDLTATVDANSRDEIGMLKEQLNTMVADLREAIGEVSQASSQVAASAEEIATATRAFSDTADEQVRSAEETSASMEEIASQINRVARSAESLATSVDQTSSSVGQMSASIEQTARSAESLGASVDETSTTVEEMVASITQVGSHVQETRRIAEAADSDAREGGEHVSRTRAGMDRIHREMSELVETIKQLDRAGESIGRMSELIEDIADQTNLLALNASIEAARAGDQGRGFAVVAREIRQLAERSVEAAREIGGSVGSVREEIGSVVGSAGGVAERTREGIELADAAAGALDKIVDSVGRTRQLMDEVATATTQQVDAAEQTLDAVRHIRTIAEETRIANRQQADASRQIVEAVDNMNRQTQLVFDATSEQKKGGELILTATENVAAAARTAQATIEEMTAAANDLSQQASRLTELVSRFRV